MVAVLRSNNEELYLQISEMTTGSSKEISSPPKKELK